MEMIWKESTANSHNWWYSCHVSNLKAKRLRQTWKPSQNRRHHEICEVAFYVWVVKPGALKRHSQIDGKKTLVLHDAFDPAWHLALTSRPCTERFTTDPSWRNGSVDVVSPLNSGDDMCTYIYIYTVYRDIIIWLIGAVVSSPLLIR